ncbi:MAG: DUF6752 domain-containing protein [Marmoricola sp.]
MAPQNLRRLMRPYQSLVEVRQRIQDLEAEVQENRQLNLRLAELCDVMMELLLPVADRDEKEVAAILERYRKDVSDPIGWREQG